MGSKVVVVGPYNLIVCRGGEGGVAVASFGRINKEEEEEEEEEKEEEEVYGLVWNSDGGGGRKR